MLNKLLILLACLSILLSCIPRPKHTNPYDPKTPNTAPIKLAVPPDSLVKSVSNNEIELEWPLVSDQDVDDFEAYNIWRVEDLGAPPSPDAMPPPIARITSYVRTSHTDKGLKPNTAYLYAITVEDQGGLQSTPSWTRVRTSPFIKLNGEFHGELAVVNHMFMKSSSDSITIFALGKRDNGQNALSYVTIPVSDGNSDAPKIIKSLDMTVLDSLVRPTPSLNGPTPLENALYKAVLLNFIPNEFDSSLVPPGPNHDAIVRERADYATSPLSIDVDSNRIWEYQLSLDLGAADKDTVFIAFSFFVRHNKSKIDSAAFALDPTINKVGQIGMRGVLVMTLDGFNVSQRAALLPITKWQEMPLVAPDQKFIALDLTPNKRGIVFMATGGSMLLQVMNRQTGVVTQIPYTQIAGFDPMNAVLFTKNLDGTDFAFLASRSKIMAVNLATNAVQGRIKTGKILFEDIQSIFVDNNENIYVIDGSNTGLNVIDTTKTIVSKWTSAGRRELDFGPGDQVLGIGNIVLFTTDTRKIWRTLP